MKEWHQKESVQVVQELNTHLNQGLSLQEAKNRLAIHGQNELFGNSGPSAFKVFLSNFFNAMNFILLVALIFSAAVLQDWVEVGILAFVIVTNTGVGFYQEFRSEKTMEALKKLSSPVAKVKRDGNVDLIVCGDVVPGDVAFLDEGSIVPADMYLIESVNLQIDEAILTGESIPVTKSRGVVQEAKAPLGDRVNMAFKNTLVSRGRGSGIVVATGLKTEIGKIAQMVTSASQKRAIQGHHVLDDPTETAQTQKALDESKWRQAWIKLCSIFTIDKLKTPLQQSLDRLMIALTFVAIILALIVFASNNFVFDEGYVILYAVGVAVAILPEGLPAVITVTMALGVRRMAKQKAIVRKLAALEALGQVTNICSDKTGTLTEGRMVAKWAWFGGRFFKATGEGITPTGSIFSTNGLEESTEDALIQSTDDSNAPLYYSLLVCLWCNSSSLFYDPKEDRWKSTGDPTEVALEVFAYKLQFLKSNLEKEFEFISEIPFDSILKRMTVVYYQKSLSRAIFLSKGAVESVLSCCSSFVNENSEVKAIDTDLRTNIHKVMLQMSSKGMRVLALAYKLINVPNEASQGLNQKYNMDNRQDVEKDLVFLGLMAIYDPPRSTSAEAVALCHQAGIEVHMATGDHPSTAVSIALEIGILEKNGLSVNDILKRQDLAITAVDFEKLTDAEIDALPSLPRVLARCSPSSKVRLIEALHRRNKFVAMTGDGVNDAPAVKKSDIGIAMGLGGSDVTKNASEITLTDDNFVTILHAVEEGRTIFSNIQKFTLHLLSGNVSEVIVLIIGLALRDADNKAILPMSSIQILWLNMVTSSPIALALGMEKADDDVMRQPPRDKTTTLFTKSLVIDTFCYGGIMGSLSLTAFIVASLGDGPWQNTQKCYTHENMDSLCKGIYAARTTAFFSLSFMLLLHGLVCRHATKSIFQMQWKQDTRWLILGVLLGFVLVIPTAYIPGLKEAFYQGSITWEWGIVIAATILFFIFAELYKLLKRSAFNKRSLVMEKMNV